MYCSFLCIRSPTLRCCDCRPLDISNCLLRQQLAPFEEFAEHFGNSALLCSASLNIQSICAYLSSINLNSKSGRLSETDLVRPQTAFSFNPKRVQIGAHEVQRARQTAPPRMRWRPDRHRTAGRARGTHASSAPTRRHHAAAGRAAAVRRSTCRRRGARRASSPSSACPRPACAVFGSETRTRTRRRSVPPPRPAPNSASAPLACLSE